MSRHVSFTLTPEQPAEIEQAINYSPRPEVRQRAIAIRLLHLGHHPEQVAKGANTLFNRGLNTVRAVLRATRVTGKNLEGGSRLSYEWLQTRCPNANPLGVVVKFTRISPQTPPGLCLHEMKETEAFIDELTFCEHAKSPMSRRWRTV